MFKLLIFKIVVICMVVFVGYQILPHTFLSGFCIGLISFILNKLIDIVLNN